MDKIIITKKIAKQGNNSVIVIPSYLKDRILPGTLVQVEITNIKSLRGKN